MSLTQRPHRHEGPCGSFHNQYKQLLTKKLLKKLSIIWKTSVSTESRGEMATKAMRHHNFDSCIFTTVLPNNSWYISNSGRYNITLNLWRRYRRILRDKNRIFWKNISKKSVIFVCVNFVKLFVKHFVSFFVKILDKFKKL